MDEKVSAIAALGAFAEACPAALLAHSAEVLSVLSDMCDYWHDEARAAAYDALGKLALAAHTAAPPMPGSGPLSPPVAALLDSVLPLLIVSVEDDRSRPAVAAAAVSLAKLLGTLPQGATAPSTLEGSANMARLLLQGRAACQVWHTDMHACLQAHIGLFARPHNQCHMCCVRPTHSKSAL